MEAMLAELQLQLQAAPFWLTILILAGSTFISEDLTTICAGILVSKGVISPVTAGLGCFLGILVGDGGLYLIGLIFREKALNFRPLQKILPPERVRQAEAWFQTNGLAIVFLSRFLPGTRLPTYFAAGVLRSKAKYFILAATLAVAIWVPLLIGLSWYFGEQMARFDEVMGDYEWLFMLAGIFLLFLFIRSVNRLAKRQVRKRIQSRLWRCLRWEFWPIPIVYLPLAPFFAFLIVRFRSLSAPLYVNPGMEYSGIVGESKNQIMEAIPDDDRFKPRSIFIEPGPLAKRSQRVLSWLEQNQLNFPVIIKPDVGQRGSGVAKIDHSEEMNLFLEEAPIPLIVQEYLPGPYEFGVFYTRDPKAERGKVWGITGKEFPKVVGDGQKTLEQLILDHPQSLGRVHIFLKRFKPQLDRVLAYGERLNLVHTGNHCQGTIFLDKSYLLTQELEDAVNDLSLQIPGFHVGRFDIRASDLESFRKGSEFKIIELNGATGEAAHMYDPKHSLLYAWKLICKQWYFIWRVGSSLKKSSAVRYSILDVFRQLSRYRKLAKYHKMPP